MKYLLFSLIFSSCLSLAEPKQHPVNKESENPIVTPIESQQEANPAIQNILNQLEQIPQLIILADRQLQEGENIIRGFAMILGERSE